VSVDEKIRGFTGDEVAAIRIWAIFLRWATADWRNLVEFSRWRAPLTKLVDLPQVLRKESVAILTSVEGFNEDDVHSLESAEAKRLSAVLTRVAAVLEAVIERWKALLQADFEARGSPHDCV
jgi:hypothetical protein